jgi:hypothetical protein
MSEENDLPADDEMEGCGCDVDESKNAAMTADDDATPDEDLPETYGGVA